jgi:UDP-2-acetamido-3-amino-2,3-dideoxy-glucuronate N-acetyltransferase
MDAMFATGKLALFSMLCLLAGPYACIGQTPQVLFITSGDNPGTEWRTISALCDLYGLTCGWRSPAQAVAEVSPTTVDSQGTLAAILEASILDPTVSRSDATILWKSLMKARIPVLILSTHPSTLAVPDANGSGPLASLKSVYLEGKLSSWQTTQTNRKVMRELTGISARIRHNTQSSVTVIGSASPDSKIAPLLLVRSADGASYPVYSEIGGTEGLVFSATFSHPVQDGGYIFEPDKDASLISVIPILTFLRFAGGQYCWHRDSDCANLTIDDPWLTEPYGNLNFEGLLANMQKARFHTTIAFIPWNYDRSSEKVVAMFKNHPEHYSISIHGNNHDHWEFYKYRTTAADPLPAKPFDVQEANIRQGLARMERFRQLTGLDFDPVMIFPHYVPPVGTFGLLKKYNFLMTANSTHIPLQYDPPPDPILYLRSVTVHFGNFASAMRHARNDWSAASIALDLFLDNPVLFFEHHSFFRGGTDAFNETAEMVNTLQPNTRWMSLGDIARRLYLERTRPDGNRDIRAFCRSIDLANSTERELTYHVEKAETSDLPIRHVRVDGMPHRYTVSDGHLRLAVAVQPRQSCRIDIEYEDSFDAAQVDISKNDPRVNRIRALSDWRDCTLERHVLTRFIVDFYYASMLYRLGLIGAAAVCFAVVAAVTATGWKLFRRIRQRALPAEIRSKHPESELSMQGESSARRQIAPDVRLGENVIVRDFVNLYGCEIGDNCRIGTFVEIQRGARIGKNCKIQSHTFICEGVTIADGVFIGHNVTFINDRFPSAVRGDGRLRTDEDWVCIPTFVKSDASIGSSVTILCGVTIGENALVGAGSVVTKDVPAGAVVAGNPARVLRTAAHSATDKKGVIV